MDKIFITGGRRLSGTVAVQGAKNSVLPLMAASLLYPGVTVLHNVPRISDVRVTLGILRALGARAELSDHTMTIDASALASSAVPDEYVSELRSSVVFLGSLLARTGSASARYPGGCELGVRPIDLHLTSLEALGAVVDDSGGMIACSSPDGLCGQELVLSFPSVGATENAMLAACGASGITRITNAAREPEICDLQSYLRLIGFRCAGAGGGTIELEGNPGGVRPRGALEFTVMPDRIAGATYLCAAACAGGRVTVSGADPRALAPVTALLSDAGCELSVTGGSVTVVRNGVLRAFRPVRTMPYPGFPTDAQPMMMAAAAVASGTTMFSETIFQNRYRHVPELQRMGADIRVSDRVAVVTGVPRLSAAPVEATDLRAAAALAVAGLSADGTTELSGMRYAERGYDDLAGVLRSLGGDVRTGS